MAGPGAFQRVAGGMKARCSDGWTLILHRGPGQIQFWFIALVVGITAALAAVLFRLGIEWIQTTVYGSNSSFTIHSFAATLPWYWVMIVPIVGGFVVGQILHHFTPDGRVRSVADVIEGAALNDGRVERRAGMASAAASMITLGTGGSTGREGPVVHLAGLIATKVSNVLNADGITGRDLLGCAVAAAVSASFNAPIAGALFALEVILRHFALHAFAPIVVASAAGTVINRLVFGDVTQFDLGLAAEVEFYQEMPAFFILGLVCGLIAVATMKAIFLADDAGTAIQTRTGVPRWLRPVVAGAALGAIAIPFPHIIGVGYETTFAALEGSMLAHEAMVFCVIKVIAVAITMGGRMGGGVFSPSLMIGALAGLSFGMIATSVFPEASGSTTLYALAGMGAVSAAVLGAPISTTLIVFELTGDWQTGLAVMVSVSMSTALASRLVHRSFFLTQLERRNIHLAAGPQTYLLAMFGVARVMRPVGESALDEEACWAMIRDGQYVDIGATLETAMPVFDRTGVTFLPVVALSGEDHAPELKGALFQVDALRAYNKALAATAAEEHS